jgi:hypothetical protein
MGMYAVISFSDSPFNINPDLTFQLPYWGGFSALNGGYDFNSDGYDDILCVDEDNGYWEGNVDIIFGGNPMDTAVDVHIQGSDPDGVRVGEQYAVGDINGDSIDDLILSRQGLGDYAPLYLDIYYGGSAFINPKVSISLSLPHPFMWESDLLANGDINGDGYDDFDNDVWNIFTEETHAISAELNWWGSSQSIEFEDKFNEPQNILYNPWDINPNILTDPDPQIVFNNAIQLMLEEQYSEEEIKSLLEVGQVFRSYTFISTGT